MNLTVKGKNLDVGTALRTHIEENLDSIFGKYFGNPIEANVTLSKQVHLFSAQISVHVGRGILLQSEAEADQAYVAYDKAADHLSTRLRRYKRRLRDHHRAATDSRRAAQYILPADGHGEGGALEPALDAAPMIIAEMQTDIPALTVSEAVMRLDLSDQKAMMFLNRAHGGLNMVYRRNDGNIGWVDPRIQSEASARHA
ncbi:ribosome hibernation-promoting factor, HPF/YfiA family [Dongia soli]|uniref:Ribosome hibernation promoting factor n=1 Tax=Dongia soli TaxID=600628 RepID=A0ABU5E651_9PROT|nr:ribosome-associated translation inhibitor RaiA [Dongia soli]MDY0881773.1 ribosome-associated translation inhibitor RaiA [Dongia soli]